MPQPPQFVSEFVGVQALLQQVAFVPQATPHAPQSVGVVSDLHWLWQQAPEAPQAVPHAPQFAPSLRVSTQRPLQQSRPEPHAFVALHAAVQLPLMQTLPAAHCESAVQLWQEWLDRHTPEGQSVPVLQPRSQVKSLRQYWPMGHVSAGPGRHATQRLLDVSHFGVAPPHCESMVHCTHWLVALQTWPIGHGWFALQPFTQTFD